MASLMLVNPKKRRKRRTTKKRARRRPVARRRTYKKRRSYRRNPASRNPARRATGMGAIIQNTVMPAATAAAGAIGLDLIMGYLPLPPAMKAGPMRHLVKGAAAVGLGMVAQNFVKKQTAEAFTSGALTVVMYNAGKEMVGRFMPQLPLNAYEDEYDELGYYGAAYNPDMEGLDLESGDAGLMAYEDEGGGIYDDAEGFGYIEDELEL